MTIFFVSETQNSGSIRKAEKIEVKNLTAAKINATKNQAYQNTVLSIYAGVDENGYGTNEISSKDTGFSNRNEWVDTI